MTTSHQVSVEVYAVCAGAVIYETGSLTKGAQTGHSQPPARGTARGQRWQRYVGDRGDVIGVDRFGASAPVPVVMLEYGFTMEHVCTRALALLGRTHV